MNTKTIEVELRGPLSESEYQNLLTLLSEKGTVQKKQNRFLLDYSTFLEGIGERKLDVRIRVTNGKVEIIVKKGKFGGTSREEVSIFPEGDSFESSLRLMNLLGYSKAVACDRGIVRYDIDGIEIAIQDVKDFSNHGSIHSRFFEAEIMCNTEDEKEQAVNKIRQFLSANGLNEFTEQEWNQYVAKMNSEANGVFDFQNDDVSKIINLGK
jgi:adenylate cyclase class IV